MKQYQVVALRNSRAATGGQIGFTLHLNMSDIPSYILLERWGTKEEAVKNIESFITTDAYVIGLVKAHEVRFTIWEVWG